MDHVPRLGGEGGGASERLLVKTEYKAGQCRAKSTSHQPTRPRHARLRRRRSFVENSWSAIQYRRPDNCQINTPYYWSIWSGHMQRWHAVIMNISRSLIDWLITGHPHGTRVSQTKSTRTNNANVQPTPAFTVLRKTATSLLPRLYVMHNIMAEVHHCFVGADCMNSRAQWRIHDFNSHSGGSWILRTVQRSFGTKPSVGSKVRAPGPGGLLQASQKLNW